MKPFPLVTDVSNVSAKQLAPIQDALPEGVHDRLREMAELVFVRLTDLSEIMGCKDQKMMASVSVDLVDVLSSRLGGAGFYMPKGLKGLRKTRNDAILEQLEKGVSYHAIARKMGLSDMRVRQLEGEFRFRKMRPQIEKALRDGAVVSQVARRFNVTASKVKALEKELTIQ